VASDPSGDLARPLAEAFADRRQAHAALVERDCGLGDVGRRGGHPLAIHQALDHDPVVRLSELSERCGHLGLAPYAGS
jgi:hypothetical protein